MAMTNRYNFFTGEIAKKVRKTGYKYLGRGNVGKISRIKIDGKTAYYLSNDFGRVSPYTFDKSKFKKVSYEEWEYESRDSFNSFIEVQDPEKIITFDTKIKKGEFLSGVEFKLGKGETVLFPLDLNESEIIKRLQLNAGDCLMVTIKKVE